MKLIFGISSLGKGGAEKNFFSLISSLYKTHDILVITFDNQGIYYREIVKLVGENNTVYLNKDKLGLPALILKLRRILIQTSPDRIISYLFNTNYLFSLSNVGLNFKIILSERNNYRQHLKNKGNYYVLFILLKFSYRRAYKIITVSKKIGSFIAQDFNINKDKIFTLYNGISVDQFLDDSFSADHHVEPKGTIRIIAVARLMPQKNYPMLLKAFKIVSENYSGTIELNILGDGPEKDNLIKLASDLDLNNVNFLGLIQDVKSLMKNSYLFVLSSNYEGFPNSLLEAMYLNGLVLSTDCDTGPSELIIHGENGFLSPVDNVNLFANAILNILHMDNKSIDLIRFKARKTAEKFSIQNMVSKFEQFLS